MATTAAGTPYVEASDLVAGYPAVSLALANHIDTLGKVLQVVRATDSTNSSTTSTSFVDVTGMSVTITPSFSTSNILLISHFLHEASGSAAEVWSTFQITNASNTLQSGGQGWNGTQSYSSGTAKNFLGKPTLIAWASPASTSPVTYKLRMKSGVSVSATTIVYNVVDTGQMFAKEVAA